ncbi:alpha/beta fold hydrolase [Amycolatopsis magusensis]|uniref:alpha/beta fold hydrolase n=1 Tax=Amycolatopsis magusensis TaxID=882444 RepID=UPI0037B17C5B
MTVATVLVPGMLCDAALWDGVRGDLGPDVVDVEITAGDIGGMAEQVLAAVPGPFRLVGLSLGAIVGFEVLRRAPDRVRGLCAISTNAGAPRPEQRQGWLDLARSTVDGQFDAVVRERIAPTMFADGKPELIEAFMAMAHRVGPAVFLRQLAAQATRRDQHGELSRHHIPALVLCGDRDALCPPAFHERLAAALPAADLKVLPGAGHLLPWEADLGSLLREHLDIDLTEETKQCPKS